MSSDSSYQAVKTPSGRKVHWAFTYDRPDSLFARGSLKASVVCNRVPSWHEFEVTTNSVDCPGCLDVIHGAGRRSLLV
jgi:hypothetical protein